MPTALSSSRTSSSAAFSAAALMVLSSLCMTHLAVGRGRSAAVGAAGCRQHPGLRADLQTPLCRCGGGHPHFSMVCGHNSNRLQAVGSPATSACSALTGPSQEVHCLNILPVHLFRCGASSPLAVQHPAHGTQRCVSHSAEPHPGCQVLPAVWCHPSAAGPCAVLAGSHSAHRGWLCGSHLLALRWPLRALTVQTGHAGHAAQPQYTDRPSLLRCWPRCSRVSLTRTALPLGAAAGDIGRSQAAVALELGASRDEHVRLDGDRLAALSIAFTCLLLSLQPLLRLAVLPL
jgi:hypothetical protein